MLKPALIAYAARVRALRLAHQDISEAALAPEFAQLILDCLPLLPAAPQLAVIPEFQNPGVGRPDIALKRPGQPRARFHWINARRASLETPSFFVFFVVLFVCFVFDSSSA